jgi:trimethylamine--corrinoid protein Co-methyltransferase
MKDYDLATQPSPFFDRLGGDGVAAIHETSMHIIETLGIRINHDGAVAVLEEHGADVDDDNVVTLPRDVVERCVASAPSSFTLHARNPDNNVVVGDGRSTALRAPGYGPANIHTFEDGRRRSTLSDFEDLLKLVHVEDVLNCTGYSACEPTDVDRQVKHLELVRGALTFTDLPPMVSPYGEDRAQAGLDMVAIAVDDPDLRKPTRPRSSTRSRPGASTRRCWAAW